MREREGVRGQQATQNFLRLSLRRHVGEVSLEVRPLPPKELGCYLKGGREAGRGLSREGQRADLHFS